MADIKLDENNDIAIENNDITIISGTQEVRQRLLQNLKSFRGDWFLNLTSGVPYFENIFRKDYDIEVIGTVIKDAIINTVGVMELLDFDLSIDDSARTLNLSFNVRTIDETITISEVLI